MSHPAPCSSNSSQRGCKYKSVAYWEMRVVTTGVSGQSVSNSLGSSDQFLTCSRSTEWSSSQEWWCVLQKGCSKPVAFWKFGVIIEIHKPCKLHGESLLCSSGKEVRTADLMLLVYLFSKIAEKNIRRQISIFTIARQRFSSSSKKGKVRNTIAVGCGFLHMALALSFWDQKVCGKCTVYAVTHTIKYELVFHPQPQFLLPCWKGW